MDVKVKAEPKTEIVKPKEVEQNEVLTAILELTVKDKDGKVTEHRVLKSESFVGNRHSEYWSWPPPVP